MLASEPRSLEAFVLQQEGENSQVWNFFDTLPNMLSRDDKAKFTSLQFVRILFAVGASVFIAQTGDLGTGTAQVSLAAVIGTLVAGIFLKRDWTFLRVVFIHAALLALTFGILAFTNSLLISESGEDWSKDFLIYRIQDHIVLLLLFYSASFLGTWFFWTTRLAVTLEALAFSIGFVWFLSGHQNYHLDAPKKVSSLAWGLGIAPEYFLLGLGGAFTTLLGFYLILASSRPLFRGRNPLPAYGPARTMLNMGVASFFLILLFSYASYIHSTYSADLSRASNGVGQGSEEGRSPLGFHDAVGKTKQPAALVRLEGDYEKNPWAPMLYIREGALSLFNGRELVLADSRFDTDVPRIRPGQPFIAIEKKKSPTRDYLNQSIYLLKNHTAPFALDFPVSMRLIRNPDPERFDLAYQALSLAPLSKLDSLVGEKVGSENWDERTRQHYLRAPGSSSEKPLEGVDYESSFPILDENGEDLRYKAFAESLVKDIPSPVMKAAAISRYLSKASIYTRKPEHQVTERGDPVAPYLFAEKKRGYCVHFAHAAAYLMRLAGVPSRIGTGYLTDLTYAKDGHILLHMGDRHAWPEIYVTKQGWMVVDVTPANAENEQVLVPDEGLLEELMSKIDPAEELLSPPELENDSLLTDKTFFDGLLNKKLTWSLIAGTFLLWISFKLFLRHGYLIISNPKRKIRFAYYSFATTLADLGIFREEGETRKEFAKRLASQGVDSKEVTKLLEQANYSKQMPHVNNATLRAVISTTNQSYDSSGSRWKRWLALLSPVSLNRFRKW